jgi:hypothetical protein
MKEIEIENVVEGINCCLRVEDGTKLSRIFG